MAVIGYSITTLVPVCQRQMRSGGWRPAGNYRTALGLSQAKVLDLSLAATEPKAACGQILLQVLLKRTF